VISLLASVGLLKLRQGPITVEVRPSDVISRDFRGVGIQVDPFFYEPSAEKWKLIKARLDVCRPGFFRVVFQNDSYCRKLDAHGDPIFLWDSEPNAPKLHQVYEILDYAQSRHIKVLLGEWGTPGFWGDGSKFSPKPGDPLWSKLVVGLLTHLVLKRGYTCINEFDYFNEPNGDWSGNPSYETWLTGVRAVGSALKASPVGKYVTISGPSASGDTGWLDALQWLDRAAKDAPETFGSYNLHWYAKDREVVDGLIETQLIGRKAAAMKLDPSASKKQFFMGESGLIEGKTNGDQQPRVKTFEYGVRMADYFAQVCRAGWTGATYWDLDDAMHPVRGNDPYPPGPLTLKVWGFWNSVGDAMRPPEDTGVRQPFYAWTLISRMFPAGCSIVAVNAPSLPGFRVTACVYKGRRSLMVVNDSAENRTVSLDPSFWKSKRLLEYAYAPGLQTDPTGKPSRARVLKGFGKGPLQLEVREQSCVVVTGVTAN
jgi:hypothetical protein